MDNSLVVIAVIAELFSGLLVLAFFGGLPLWIFFFKKNIKTFKKIIIIIIIVVGLGYLRYPNSLVFMIVKFFAIEAFYFFWASLFVACALFLFRKKVPDKIYHKDE